MTDIMQNEQIVHKLLAYNFKKFAIIIKHLLVMHIYLLGWKNSFCSVFICLNMVSELFMRDKPHMLNELLDIFWVDHTRHNLLR